MRKVHNRLRDALIGHIADFVHHQRQQNRDGRIDRQPKKAQHDGVFKAGEEVLRAEHAREVGEAQPFTADDSLCVGEILERDDHARTWACNER